ncbi:MULTISPECIES: hypothetical protein [Nostocales]|uniref:Uncharacterized protein n=3 Tax=Nostocales TaxID=1161 RepID=A0A8S9TEP1_9CYAN|nr:hypothetical protein [Tolypothrix bouteillei]KAF3889949.1 hypothetical protein DA73_0400034135 [Tolypothrix bouteillei VB521301]
MLTTQASSFERRIVRLFKHLIYSMMSPWQCPLPIAENTTDKVALYFYKNDRWVPIMFYKLEEAIALYHQSQSYEMQIQIFPPELNPNDFDLSSYQESPPHNKLPSNSIRV